MPGGLESTPPARPSHWPVAGTSGTLSHTFSSNHAAEACDRESDSNQVHNDIDYGAEGGTLQHAYDPNGNSANVCGTCAAGIRRPDSGTVMLAGTSLFAMPSSERSRLRLTSMGMVFQFSELLPELTVTENVALPLRLAGQSKSEVNHAATDCLKSLGLANLLDSRPGTLGRGTATRRDRPSHSPPTLADEPTGMLDDRNSELVMETMLGRR